MTSEDSESIATVYLRLREVGLALLVMDLNLTCSTSVSRCTSTFELSTFRYAIGKEFVVDVNLIYPLLRVANTQQSSSSREPALLALTYLLDPPSYLR
jgi:hypothetical protein